MKDYELDGLPDEQLIAYVAKARHAGAADAARLGLAVFANRRFDQLTVRAKAKLPTWEDAEEVAMRTIEGVLKAAFDGEAVGEAVNFIHRILARRIADFYKARKETDPLPEEQVDDERKSRDAGISEDDKDVVEVQEAVERAYERLKSPHHRQVIDDFVFNGYDAEETADRINTSYPDLDTPMSDQNVHKIASRFRKDLRGDLELD